MLSIPNETKRRLLLTGCFGLEKESLRVTPDGYMAHTPHPFPDHENITRDFCENQTEINTPVTNSATEAYESLKTYYTELQQMLAAGVETADGTKQPELLWPFSNPPYIRSEEDIPVAEFKGDQTFKTHYRRYLSDRYGRYLMTFCGIHFNYSFSDELLWEGFLTSGLADERWTHSAKPESFEAAEKQFTPQDKTAYQEYKNRFYLELAKKATAYGWLINAVTAASPVLDRSYLETGKTGGAVFTGKGSVRGSENGYWNFFTPVFDYHSLTSYTNSIQNYVAKGLLAAPSELYYPVRLKPRGQNDLTKLQTGGVNHIELRNFDLNPLDPAGVDPRDVAFGQLFLCFLACTQDFYFPEQDQVQAVQNMKNAAHYDLEHTKIVILGGHCCSVSEAGTIMLRQMKDFYKDFGEDVQAVLDFEAEKFENPESRYAVQVRTRFGDSFVEQGLALARERQEEALV